MKMGGEGNPAKVAALFSWQRSEDVPPAGLSNSERKPSWENAKSVAISRITDVGYGCVGVMVQREMEKPGTGNKVD
jgi:hypothetical protein